jgi:hypothetical protein
VFDIQECHTIDGLVNYLKIWRYMTYLYRGTGHFIEDGICENENLKRPRVPKTTPSYIHEAADDWFKENLGVRARSQTIFCTPCRKHASSHFESGGSLLEISLMGESNLIIFSEEVGDFLDIIPKDAFKSEDNSKFNIAKELDTLNYRVVNNVHEIPENFTGEIMLYCTEFEVKNID